ncbi:hypothetical protein [Salimicrobium flavidum]|uniref:Uncharacterized protein n=1 Tax=Salimicrobium flavidum TaxID=570947 RepID=A0A1N7JIA3_9BACI|nr:hypothetical protein [Salimicrobium flavidum]SIS49057.1 hypothetical protein SAMN05421687_10691 [Salimicrobium flavidum]
MYPLYYTIAIIICIIALVGTISIGRNLIKQEKVANSSEELDSLKTDSTKNSSFRRLGIIYAITLVITVALLWIFVF